MRFQPCGRYCRPKTVLANLIMSVMMVCILRYVPTKQFHLSSFGKSKHEALSKTSGLAKHLGHVRKRDENGIPHVSSISLIPTTLVPQEHEDDKERSGGRQEGEKKNKHATSHGCKHSKKDVINIVTSGDSQTFAPMVTLATSILMNTQSSVMFHFITYDTLVTNLSAVLQSSIVPKAAYEIVPFPETKLEGQFVVRAPRKDLANPLNFVRFYLPELLPCVDYLAYIDVDCLVLGDVKDLYSTPINDSHVIAGLTEENKDVSTLFNFSNPHVKNLSITKETRIMSAGVFVANMTRWKEGNITLLLDYWMKLNVRSKVIKFSGRGAGSQAVMNLALYDKHSPLDESWNRLYANQGKDEKPPRANLLHWSGQDKPWSNKSVKNAHLWHHYFKLSQAKIPKIHS